MKTSELTAGEINAELDRVDKKLSKLCDEFIADGRGHEKPSETFLKDDALSLRYKSLSAQRYELRVEVLMRYGPNAPERLPRGFNGRKS